MFPYPTLIFITGFAILNGAIGFINCVLFSSHGILWMESLKSRERDLRQVNVEGRTWHI
jgi:cell division septal protein FtsQ